MSGGRPLDPQIDDAIVRAATAMLLEHGIQRMTVPGVAAAAGVAKTTVYRRYATPLALVLAAIDRLNADDPRRRHRRRARGPGDGARAGAAAHRPTVTATVLVEAQTHPEVLEAARRQMIGPAVERFRRVLRAGVARGELRADLDVEIAADAILGSFFTHCYERGRPGPEWPERAIATIWPGLTGSAGVDLVARRPSA